MKKHLYVPYDPKNLGCNIYKTSTYKRNLRVLAYIVYYTLYNTERCSFCFLCFVLTRYVGYTNARVSENQTYVETGKNVKIVVKHKALVQFRFIAFSTKRFLIEFIDLTSNYLVHMILSLPYF